jgi:hypothetical protein
VNSMHYVGLDVHKKTISYCVRQADGTIIHEGVMEANRPAVDAWRKQLPDAWTAGMEATMFTGWIYDHLVSNGAAVKVGHAAMLKAIAAGKKKNDRVDARKLADLLRCDYFPECHMAPRELRDRRRVLRKSESAGAADRTHEEPGQQPADGNGYFLQQGETPSEEVFWPAAAGAGGRDAGIAATVAETEPEHD